METKNIILSKTIIAILTAIVVLIAKHYGYHLNYDILDHETQTTIGNYLQYSSLCIDLYGRFTAKTKLSIRQKI